MSASAGAGRVGRAIRRPATAQAAGRGASSHSTAAARGALLALFAIALCAALGLLLLAAIFGLAPGAIA
jgi:hypothetical protein